MENVVWYNLGKESIPLTLNLYQKHIADVVRVIRNDIGEHAPSIQNIRILFKRNILKLKDEIPTDTSFENPLIMEYTPDGIPRCIGKMVEGRAAIEATVKVEQIDGGILGYVDSIIDTGSEYPFVVPISLIRKWKLIQIGLDLTEGTGIQLKMAKYKAVNITMQDDEVGKDHSAPVNVFSIIGATTTDGKDIELKEENQVSIVGLPTLELLRLWIDAPEKTLRRMYLPKAPHLITKHI